MCSKPLASVSFLAIYRCGKILVQDHKKTGMLTIPGGSVEGNEEPIDAFYREMREELGVDHNQITLLGRENHTHQKLTGEQGELEHRFIAYMDFNWENKEPLKHPWIGPMSINQLEKSDRTLSTYLTSVVERFKCGEYDKYLTA